MRLAWALSAGTLVLSSACFVDLTGEGGARPGDSTSVFMSGGGPQGTGGDPGSGGGGSGGGTTTTGMGGADVCGDGTVQAPESCDDGNVIDGDGCTADCKPEMLASCTKEPPYMASLGEGFPPLVVSGSTRRGTDNLRLGEDGSCQSDAPDQWLPVRMETSGTVNAKLTVTEGFGGMHDKAILHVRNACPDLPFAGELVCMATDAPVTGEASLDIFVREGEIYYFAVDGKGMNDVGAYELELSQTSFCGDGLKAGMEQCDGELGCAGCMLTTCMFGALGDGVFDQPSQRCFLDIATGKNFWKAREECVLAGGDLVGPIAKVAQFPVFNGEFWVGLADFNKGDMMDDFEWLIGAADTVEGPNHLDQNRLRCVSKNGATKDQRYCDLGLGSICELRFAND